MKRPIFIGMLAAVACALLIPAATAQADAYSCVFTGAMGPLQPFDPNDNGAESILTDINQGGLLLDSDYAGTTPDGEYHFGTLGAPIPAQCLAVDDVGEASTDTGLYSAVFASSGVYHSYICGTGSSSDPGPEYSSTLDLTPIAALGPGEDITEADLTMQYYAGSGRLNIFFATNGDGLDPETGGGLGTVNLVPTTGNCLNQDVSVFQVSGAFGLGTNGDPDALR